LFDAKNEGIEGDIQTTSDRETLMLRIATYLLLLAAFSPACWAQATSNQASVSPGFKRVGIASVINSSASATPKYNGIPYQGGPIIDDANGVNVYYIWYGDWSKNIAAQTIVTDFIKHLGGSPYTTVNTTYYDYEAGPTGTNVVKDRVTTGVNYMGSTNDYYSQGVNLDDNAIGTVMQNAIADGRLPPLDHNGVYFVITSADVKETSGFCTYYCAFHGSQPLPNGDNIIGGFIGNPEQCPTRCAWQPQLPTPNNNVAADSMANMIAHETEESVTDPLGTSWVDYPSYEENEDKCAWTFGKTYNLSNGSFANMKLGQRQYLIQQNWVNAKGGYCALKWDE
jgi:hypothetical protein